MTSTRVAGPSPKSRSNASDTAARAWECAIRLLTAHDRSEHELRSRLAAQGISASAIHATIRRLHRLHYLDDRRFARGTAESAARRGQGSERVRAQLVAKGVAETLIDEALQGAFADETQLARQALARRYPTAPTRPAEQAKAARYLLRQGFPEAVVRSVLGEEVC